MQISRNWTRTADGMFTLTCLPVSVMFATYVDLPELGVPGIVPPEPVRGGRSRAFPHSRPVRHGRSFVVPRPFFPAEGTQILPGWQRLASRPRCQTGLRSICPCGTRISGRSKPAEEMGGRLLAQQYPGLHGETSHPSETLRVKSGTGQPRSLDFPAIRILIAAAPSCFSGNSSRLHTIPVSVHQLLGFRAAAVLGSSCLASHPTLEGLPLQRWSAGE